MTVAVLLRVGCILLCIVYVFSKINVVAAAVVVDDDDDLV